MGTYERVLKAAVDVANRIETQLNREFKKRNYAQLQPLGAEWERAQDLVKYITKIEGGSAAKARANKQAASAEAPAEAPAEPADEPQKRRRMPTKKGYPKFERQGDNLVKVEWKNDKKKEARQRVSYGTMSLLTQAISKDTGESFKKTLLDEVTHADGKKVPNHQIHAILLWLQHIKAIERRRRGDYYSNLNKLSPSSLKSSFDNTPETQKGD